MRSLGALAALVLTLTLPVLACGPGAAEVLARTEQLSEPTLVPPATTAPILAPTPTPAPTLAPTAAPSSTPVPQATAPTAAPAPAAPAAPAAPEPTATSVPTAAPTATPVPTPVPAGDEAGPTAAAQERQVSTAPGRTLAMASGLALAMPVESLEIIGFHEAGHPGSQALNAAANLTPMLTMETRGRGTPPRSAADIVVPPGQAVLAPATGTVIAANPYVLYCDYDDALVYIEPDHMPGWEVRVFHIDAIEIAVGSRVIAGETLIAGTARTLPFESQVDEHTSEPSWPHIHVEVVDTSVPDTRPPGPGCP